MAAKKEIVKSKQLIVVCENYEDQSVVQKAIAKAPIMLVTRCMEGMHNFIGKDEAKLYQEMLMSWITDSNANIDVRNIANSEIMGTIEWTAEIMGIPCQVVQDANGVDVCCAIGPSSEEKIDELINNMF